jgi:hypothetical protein
MTPVEPLHNLTGVPPISYLLPKLIHTYKIQLQGLPPSAKVCIAPTHNACRYWPDYITPPTTLSHISAHLSPNTYRPTDLCKTGQWSHPNFTYNPPSPNHKSHFVDYDPMHIHIMIHPHTHNNIHTAIYCTSPIKAPPSSKLKHSKG